MLLVARSQLASHRQTIANTIRGLFKTFGLIIVRGQRTGPRSVFASRESAMTCWRRSSRWCSPCGVRCGSRSRYSTDKSSLGRARYRRAVSDDNPRRRGPRRLRPVHRRSRAVPAIGFQRRLSRPHATALPVRRRRHQRAHLQMRRCAAARYLFEVATVLLQRHSRVSAVKTWGWLSPSGSVCDAPSGRRAQTHGA